MKIREQDKQRIINIIKDTIKESCKILAYGSRVNGDAYDMSDLDLVLISQKKDKIDINTLVKFKEKLQKSNIPIIVQVMDWYRIPKSFQENILKKNELFFKV